MKQNLAISDEKQFKRGWDKMKRTLPFIVAMTLLTTLLWGCQAKKTHTEIIISAAASLTDAFKEINTQFSQDFPGIDVRFNFGASGTLQSQIEQGAPVDVFASAGKRQMDALGQKGLVEDPVPFAKNELVLITQRGNPLKLHSFEELASAKVTKLALGNPASVPAGQYGIQVLNFYKLSLADKLVPALDVRQVLQWVGSGDAQAGLVYLSDSKVSDKVTTVALAPPNSHQDIIYPLAVIKASKHKKEARAWADYLLSGQAQTILEKYGFVKVNQ